MDNGSILLSKPAKKLQKGQLDVPGSLTITDAKLIWTPEDVRACNETVIILKYIKSMFH